MTNAIARLRQNSNKATFVLQLTAMVDMFTILIVFLLKSYSTSAITVTPHDGLKLPFSTSQSQPIEALRMVVSMDGIYVGDEKIVSLSAGQIDSDELDKKDGAFIKGLYKELDRQALKSKDIADKNTEHEFKGQILLQADNRLDYELLEKVMYTSTMAGYADLRLAIMAVQ